MTYPSAPWTLKGYAFLTLQWIDVEKARPFIPTELEIISLWPGKTLGGVYISSYGLGSVMEYNELIITSALVRYAGKVGSWVSHIYVDNPNSVAGGREIWGLPKELAEFNWEEGKTSCVSVAQGNQELCSLTYSQPSWSWQLPFTGNILSALGGHFLSFQGEFQGKVGWIASQLKIPPASPFASLNLGQSWLSFACEEMNFVAGVPQVIGNRAVEYSY